MQSNRILLKYEQPDFASDINWAKSLVDKKPSTDRCVRTDPYETIDESVRTAAKLEYSAVHGSTIIIDFESPLPSDDFDIPIVVAQTKSFISIDASASANEAQEIMAASSPPAL